MSNSSSQFTDDANKLPIEYPLKDALIIYSKRLTVFLAIVAINIAIFLSFLAIQRLSSQATNLPNIGALIICSLPFIFPLLLSYFIYQRSNPVRGYLVFSEGDKVISKINLYSGRRITKKDFYRYEPYLSKKIILTARNTGHRRKRSVDATDYSEIRQIYLQLKDKSQNVDIFEGELMEGETARLPDGMFVSYREKTG